MKPVKFQENLRENMIKKEIYWNILNDIIWCWKKFFSMKHIEKITKKYDDWLKPENVLRTFIARWYLWNLYSWIYFIKIWDNQPTIEEKIIEYLSIASKKYKIRKIKYYFWWPILINQYWISEQIWIDYVVYNNFLNWSRIIDWRMITFKKKSKYSDYFRRWWFQYWTIEQTIIDIIKNPEYIWYDYQKLFSFLITNKCYNIEKIISLYKKNVDKTWIKRFSIILEKIFWKKIKFENEYKVYKNIKLKTIY